MTYSPDILAAVRAATIKKNLPLAADGDATDFALFLIGMGSVALMLLTIGVMQ